ncbi:DUF547 domain-containing protein [Pontibacter sp. G13]|uniref:DUF547 domain-containing protein n=1 Tax=Pontibacter sp. G13 TaxID=3074898 RepID=UPI00288B1917|nr:DUF547 domain-containing protein [Pontibacter sp. G13]WNJ21367.1 DUF547 domain-containing protein [Pontibacter sp. G13]
MRNSAYHFISMMTLASLLLMSVAHSDTSALSHDTWGQLLKSHVSPEGKVNYEGFTRDRAKLDEYLNQLAAHSFASHTSSNAEMAFWINTYNAYTVKLILDHYPLASITDLDKPWDIAFVKAAGKTYTLNQIENEILRQKFKEPRIHFAVNCASKSCPPLLNEAYSADRLEDQLDRQTIAFVNNSQYNQIRTDQAHISELFKWYRKDFTQNGTLIEFLNQYAKAKLSPDASLEYLPYDWRLNN